MTAEHAIIRTSGSPWPERRHSRSGEGFDTWLSYAVRGLDAAQNARVIRRTGHTPSYDATPERGTALVPSATFRRLEDVPPFGRRSAVWKTLRGDRKREAYAVAFSLVSRMTSCARTVSRMSGMIGVDSPRG